MSVSTSAPQPIRIGTAGWGVPKDVAAKFPSGGSHLERYAQVFPSVEINTSFYRPHRASTYARWAASVPDGFRFSVKVPKAITHERRLDGVEDLLDRFLAEVGGLGPKLGPLLVQLPPSLSFKAGVADRFLSALRVRFAGPIACEPRQHSWFTPEIDALLQELRIARVAADPAVAPCAGEPGGWRGLAYHRLHGAPRIYYSAYGSETIQAVVHQLAGHVTQGAEGWCIFDNTALFAATPNALEAQSYAAIRGDGCQPTGSAQSTVSSSPRSSE